MVQLSSFFVVTSLFVAGLSSTPAGVALIESDISTIASQVSTLNTALTSFPTTGGTLLQALAIHTDATNLVTSLNKGTTDVNANGPVDEADGETILASIQAIVPNIVSALNAAGAKEPVFKALPINGIPALVKQDLTTLNASTTAFENALISVAPADLVAAANSLKNQVNTAFASALAAYASD